MQGGGGKLDRVTGRAVSGTDNREDAGAAPGRPGGRRQAMDGISQPSYAADSAERSKDLIPLRVGYFRCRRLPLLASLSSLRACICVRVRRALQPVTATPEPLWSSRRAGARATHRRRRNTLSPPSDTFLIFPAGPIPVTRWNHPTSTPDVHPSLVVLSPIATTWTLGSHPLEQRHAQRTNNAHHEDHPVQNFPSTLGADRRRTHNYR